MCATSVVFEGQLGREKKKQEFCKIVSLPPGKRKNKKTNLASKILIEIAN